MTEERTLRDNSGLTSQLLHPRGSIVILWVARPVTFAPRDSRISAMAETSRMTGARVRVTGPSAKREAAMSLRTEFLLPEMVM